MDQKRHLTTLGRAGEVFEEVGCSIIPASLQYYGSQVKRQVAALKYEEQCVSFCVVFEQLTRKRAMHLLLSEACPTSTMF